MANDQLFHRGHYNIIAKQIREQFRRHTTEGALGTYTHASGIPARAALVDLAISMAKRLKQDNPAFDHMKFLEACSPNPEWYPFTEFWED